MTAVHLLLNQERDRVPLLHTLHPTLKVMAYLVINKQVYSLDKQKYTIGRHSSNDIIINDVLASKYHGALTQTKDGYLIVDFSQNGTYVDGKKITSQMLKGNEEIRIGFISCCFRLGVPEHMTTEFGTISG